MSIKFILGKSVIDGFSYYVEVFNQPINYLFTNFAHCLYNILTNAG